ncbi:MAG: zinc-ribbon domain-containing protein [Promethearchaeota archaeon]
MFCTECGSQVPDDAQSCPYCGQNLEEVIELLKETPVISEKSVLKSEDIEPLISEKAVLKSEDIEPLISEKSVLKSEDIEPLISEKMVLKSDFDVFVEGEAEAVPASSMQILKVVVHNTSSKTIPGVVLQVSSTTQVRVLTRTKLYGDLLSGQKTSSFFNIRPQGPGDFHLTATLESETGHSFTYPLEIYITSVKFGKMPKARLVDNIRKTETSDNIPKTKSSYSYSRGNEKIKKWAPFIAIGLTGLILMIIGASALFQSLFGGGGMRISLSGIITMIVIGFILISIGTKGSCFGIFCDDCDC